MIPSFADHMWNTPDPTDEYYKPGYQSYYALQGYAQLVYKTDHLSATVNIITRARDNQSLQYEFDGVVQASPEKTYDSTYKGILQVRVLGPSNQTLTLDGIDFLWNVPELLERKGDFRGGKKGALAELFGWPDADVEAECQFLADSGYLGVKIFPHTEQIMSTQPMDDSLNPWYFMYQSASWRLQGRMGTRDDLRKMIQTCRKVGVRVYMDAVVNHMSGGGNDVSSHRNNNGGCTVWPGKQSSAAEGDQSPYYTPQWTYEINPATGKTNNALEYPAVPFGPLDFHCESSLASWNDANNLNTGWLVGLADLDTSSEYVQQRIADHFTDMLSIGVTGWRIDAAKHIGPDDLSAIFGRFKANLGGNIPADWFVWLEVLVGGEAELLLRDSSYSFTTHFTEQLGKAGLTPEEIDQVKLWWSAYPKEPELDDGRLPRTRKVIQNDDHDQQSDGSTSRDFGDTGCVLVKGCAPDQHRQYEVKLFTNPYGNNVDNDNDYPIRTVLSSYYFTDETHIGVPDGKSDCKLCKVSCDSCHSRAYAKAHVEGAAAYAGTDYTRVHRDPEIISAIQRWMHI